MASNILGAIANPGMADIAGALDYREKKIQEDEELRKRIRAEELIGKALSSGLQEGSVLAELAKTNPNGYLAISKSLGIDPSDGSGINQMTIDVNTINRLANAGDIQGAFNYMQNERNRRAELGLKTDYLDQGLASFEQDPHRFFNAVDILDNSLNPRAAKEGFTLSEGQTRFDAQGNAIASVAKAPGSGSGDNNLTAEQKNWAEYQRLLKEDPAQAEQFAIATRFSSNEGRNLSSFAEKEVAKSSDEYTTAVNAVSRYRSLAEKLKSAKTGGGLKSTWTEFVKEQTGNQDELTALKKEALAITNSEAINSLPPGPATDRDIELARAPFPTEKADPIYVANWLGAISRLNEKKAQYAAFKADFIGKHGTVRSKDGKTLVSAWKDLQKEQGNAPAEEAPKASLDDLVNKYAK